jgi:hypothetical protein
MGQYMVSLNSLVKPMIQLVEKYKEQYQGTQLC